MDSFDINSIKVRKAHAVHKYRQLQKITSLFRIIEICVILILISRFSSQFPIASKFSGDYFRELSVVLISPRFVFVIGNVIIITLFARSGQFSAKEGIEKNSGTDFYHEFIEKRTEKNQKIEDTAAVVDTKIYRRSQSDNLKHEKCKQSRHVLRRSVTEKRGKSVDSGEKPAGNSYPVDGLSNEEFRQTIEAFIARQRRFRREEEYSPFVL